jgi:hypothetical protein
MISQWGLETRGADYKKGEASVFRCEFGLKHADFSLNLTAFPDRFHVCEG